MTEPTEGQTARDVSFEDDGIPDLQDGTPGAQAAEDPEFMPLPGERAGASDDFGTTAAEQAEGESLDGRLAREVPEEDPADQRPAEDPAGTRVQLEQDVDADPGSDSGTGRTGDDVAATADAPAGGEGPESAAVHLTDG